MIQINLYYVIGIFFISIYVGQAQDSVTAIEKDTSSLAYSLKKGGRFYANARSYFSTTINDGELSDYYAWAIGLGIRYETPKFFRYFQVSVGGFSMFNLASSDLLKADLHTNQVNRYEVGLFDILKPDNRQDLNRLEELMLKVQIAKKSQIAIGRQIPDTPFINPQDGRMRPTLIEGITINFNEWNNLRIHGVYIRQISPRSTMQWFNVGKSIGIYPVGVGPTGSLSKYKDNTVSAGIGILGISYQKKNWNIQIWNNYVHNLTNTGFLKIEWKSTPDRGQNWFCGGQLIHQSVVGAGGNQDPDKAYASKNNSANIISARFGRQSSKFTWFVNATRITDEGRYLMPREWGKEPFYTFIPRERNEGFGDLTAITFNTFLKATKNIRLELSGGYFQLPDVKHFTLNKYGMPSYSQINLSLNYQFGNYLKGLNLFMLLMRKDETGETYHNPRFIFNKVNMTHFNLVINYQY